LRKLGISNVSPGDYMKMVSNQTKVVEVLFANASNIDMGNSLVDKVEKLWKKTGLDRWICRGERILLKTHFGHYGATHYLRPIYLWKLVDLTIQAGGIPAVAETCGLGLSRKDPYSPTTLPGYIQTASRNGHSISSLRAPVIMLDGYWGTETIPVEANGKFIKVAHVAMGLCDYDKVLVIARFKGHDGMGFGGALKQLGVGCVGKQGKGEMHYGKGNFYIKTPKNCNQCGKCLKVCPTRCISLVNGNPVIDEKRCITCFHCSGVCHQDKKREERVFGIRKGLEADEQVIRMIENAVGVVKLVGEDNLFYFNFAIDIGPACDCAPFARSALVPDQGILASKDLLAIDQACVDLVTKAKGIPGSPLEVGLKDDLAQVTIHGSPSYLEPNFQKLGILSTFVSEKLRPKIVEIQLEEAEKHGLGNRKYKLVPLD